MDKLNTLLVIPRYQTYGMTHHYVMPMGTLYVSAYLKKSNAANVFTLNLNHETGDEKVVLASFISQHQIDVVGIGGLSGEYQDIARMAKYTKEIKRDIIVIVGGGIMTADPTVTMEAMPEVDFGIIGEGEMTIVELLKELSDIEHKNTSSVSGIIYKESGHFIITPAREEMKDLDTLPFPDYEGFNYRDYLKENPDISDDGKKYSQVSVIGGRSCKYNCTFCFHPSGSSYRQRSLDSIFSEIDYLVSNYDISYIALREELFATDNQRVADFCKRIESYDFDWSIQLRIDSINQELVDLLSGTRCRYVFVGVESASDKVLHSMRKGINLQQIEQALNLLKEAGLNSRSGVIFGDSEETYETALFSLNWFKTHCDKYRMFVDMVISFPGSILYKRACKLGVISNPVQFLKDSCPIVNISKMDDNQFAQLVKEIEKINFRHYNVIKYN